MSVPQWVRSAIHHSRQPTSPVGFLSLKLQPPPCAVLVRANTARTTIFTTLRLRYTTQHNYSSNHSYNYTTLRSPHSAIALLRYYNTTILYLCTATLHQITLHYTTPTHTMPQLAVTTLLYTPLYQATRPYSTLHHITLHSLNYRVCNCNCATPSAPHHSYNSAALNLLTTTALHHTTSSSFGKVPAAPIATTPKYFTSCDSHHDMSGRIFGHIFEIF